MCSKTIESRADGYIHKLKPPLLQKLLSDILVYFDPFACGVLCMILFVLLFFTKQTYFEEVLLIMPHLDNKWVKVFEPSFWSNSYMFLKFLASCVLLLTDHHPPQPWTPPDFCHSLLKFQYCTVLLVLSIKGVDGVIKSRIFTLMAFDTSYL